MLLALIDHRSVDGYLNASLLKGFEHYHDSLVIFYHQVVQTSKCEGENADGQRLLPFKVFFGDTCFQCLSSVKITFLVSLQKHSFIVNYIGYSSTFIP